MAERRAVPGFPGYFVDENGDVWSAYPGGQMFHAAKQREPIRLRPAKTGNGYRSVALYRPDGTRSTRSVHRLVAEAFHGPSPFAGAHVRHLDGDGTNNRATNLAWGSQAENEADKRRHCTANVGARAHRTHLTDDDVRRIRARVAAGETRTAVAREYGVSRAAIGYIVAGRNWGHVAA